MKKIAILASGSGTNAENIANVFNHGNRVRVDVVLTNRENAGVIERMNRLNIDVEYIPNSVWDSAPARIVELLQWRGIDLVVLAGFMHYVSPVILNAFPGRVINIHPSLLPAYGGKGMWGHHVHQAVVAAGETESGVTVHYVTEEFDSGEILMQQKVPVLPGDTPESLEARIHQAEYELYPRAVLAALQRIDSASADAAPVGEVAVGVEADTLEAASPAPAPEKSVDEQWADVLKVKYDPASATVPPPVPVESRGAAQNPQSSQAPQTAQQNPRPQFFGQPQREFPQGRQSGFSPASPAEPEPMPSTYLLWSILCTLFCCFIPGIAAIVFSSMVSSRYAQGNIEGAKRASYWAQVWIIISFVLGVLSASLYLPLMLF